MKSEHVRYLSEKNISKQHIDGIKDSLEKEYDIAYGTYKPEELKKAITEDGKPFFITNHFCIGYDPHSKKFLTDKNTALSIERMVKAVIVQEPIESTPPTGEKNPFAIIGKNDWEYPIDDFYSVIAPLNLGAVFLPVHSAVFNFIEPTEKEKEDKVVSYLKGANINILDPVNYIENCFHEMGHLFWRDCVKDSEKKQWKAFFEILKPSAIYEYDWERHDAEEVFCTVYKWYLKAILLNKSFMNILEFEEPKGLAMLHNIFDRVTEDRIKKDVFDVKKEKLMEYLHPKYNPQTGIRYTKQGLFDEISDMEIPEKVIAENIDKFDDGLVYLTLGKATVPVNDSGKIVWEKVKR